MERKLISVDPGKNYFAFAQWSRKGRLEKCARVDVSLSNLYAISEPSNDLVVEVPQVYSQRHWKGDPNDLIDLAITVGRLVQAFGPERSEQVRPSHWKGTVEKKVMQERILARLDPIERQLVDPLTKRDRRDVLDAVGLGLWKLDRL